MDFLDPSSPVHARKELERAIYLRDWAPFVPAGARVLDVGGGIGRFAVWCVDRGCSVVLIEADPESLARAVAHTGGRIEAHWTTAERMPAVDGFDVAIACELLCYVESPETIVAEIRDRLAPGGVLLASVEAPNGWVAASDAAPGSLDAWMGDGVVHVRGDRFVRTYDRPSFERLMDGFDTVSLRPTHYVSSGPFEHAAGLLSVEAALRWEDRLAEDPRAADWNRAWTGVFRKR
jgi:SAM-dependent methyltransferase